MKMQGSDCRESPFHDFLWYLKLEMLKNSSKTDTIQCIWVLEKVPSMHNLRRAFRAHTQLSAFPARP